MIKGQGHMAVSNKKEPTHIAEMKPMIFVNCFVYD